MGNPFSYYYRLTGLAWSSRGRHLQYQRMQQSRPSSIISYIARTSPPLNNPSTLPAIPSVSPSANPTITTVINPLIHPLNYIPSVQEWTDAPAVQISFRFDRNRSSSCQWTNTQNLSGSLPRSSRARYSSLFAAISEIWWTDCVLAPPSMSPESPSHRRYPAIHELWEAAVSRREPGSLGTARPEGPSAPRYEVPFGCQTPPVRWSHYSV